MSNEQILVRIASAREGCWYENAIGKFFYAYAYGKDQYVIADDYHKGNEHDWRLIDKTDTATAPPASEGEGDIYTRDEVKLILSQRESYFMNHQKKDDFIATSQWLDKNYIPGLHLLPQPTPTAPLSKVLNAQYTGEDVPQQQFRRVFDAWEEIQRANETMHPEGDEPTPNSLLAKNQFVIKRAAAERGAKWMRMALDQELRDQKAKQADLAAQLAAANSFNSSSKSSWIKAEEELLGLKDSIQNLATAFDEDGHTGIGGRIAGLLAADTEERREGR